MSYSHDPRYSQLGLEYSQPGLEVAHSSDPVVVNSAHEAYPIPVGEPGLSPYKVEDSSIYSDAAYGSTVGPFSGSYNIVPDGAFSVEPKAPKPPIQTGSKKKLFLLLGALGAVAIIVGAVVGGVLGSKFAKDGSKEAQTTTDSSSSSSSPSESSSSPLPSSSASPKVNTTAVRPKTKLSVTGRRLVGDGFTSRLFWQGGDNKIRTTRYTSKSGKWTTPLVFDSTDDAKPGTPIGATIYLFFPQFEVFYVDSESTFRGINFGDDETVPSIDSINTERPAFTVDDSSAAIAAYWPYVVYRNPDATFHRLVYDTHGGTGWFNDTVQAWFFPDVIPFGDEGTGFAMVPVVKEFRTPYAAGIAFRDRDGRLAIFSFGGDDGGISWHTATPDVSISAGTAIGAFAVGRVNSDTINTHILYQDDDHKIQAVWQVDGGEWEGPEEVGEADEGTDIACLTEVVYDEPVQALLSEQPDMRRCYYQLGGFIKEKRLTSSGWVDGDTIPME